MLPSAPNQRTFDRLLIRHGHPSFIVREWYVWNSDIHFNQNQMMNYDQLLKYAFSHWFLSQFSIFFIVLIEIADKQNLQCHQNLYRRNAEKYNRRSNQLWCVSKILKMLTTFILLNLSCLTQREHFQFFDLNKFVNEFETFLSFFKIQLLISNLHWFY